MSIGGVKSLTSGATFTQKQLGICSVLVEKEEWIQGLSLFSDEADGKSSAAIPLRNSSMTAPYTQIPVQKINVTSASVTVTL